MNRQSAGTHGRIVDAATAHVRAHGLHGLTMDDVARRAGLARRTLYLHFADRDALILAVLQHTAELQVASMADDIAAHPTLAGQVGEAAVHTHALFPRDLALGLRGRRGQSEEAAARLLGEGYVLDAWLDFWTPMVEAARTRGEVREDLDPRRGAEWIVRVLMSLVTVPARTFDPEDARQVREFVTDHLIRGLADRSSPEKNHT